MTNPGYITSLKLSSLPATYEWDNALFATFWSVNDESNPRLAAAIQQLSAKACFSLGVALGYWTLARVEGRTDTTDAELRLVAARAAAIDRRYAKLTPVPESPANAVAQFASPLRLAMKLITHAHSALSDDVDDVYAGTQGLAMLVDHIVDHHPAFSSWLTESLRRAHQHYPALDDDDDDDYDSQAAVPLEFFEPGFVFDKAKIDQLHEAFLRSLDPAKNPYLATPQEMLAGGFTGLPYVRP